MVRTVVLAWLAAVAAGAVCGAIGGAYLYLTNRAHTRHAIHRLEQHANQTSSHARKEKS
jgi:hypothetical protein